MESFVEHAAVERLDAALFSGCEVIGHGEAGELADGLLQPLEARFELGGAWRTGRRLSGPEHAQRIAQKLAAVRGIGCAVGVHQRLRLTGAQAVLR